MKLPTFTISEKTHHIVLSETITFHELFENISSSYDTCFILESLSRQGATSRYSVIGFDPDHIIEARDNNLIIDNKPYSVSNPYQSLKTLNSFNLLGREYAGGLVGYLGYDAISYIEPSVSVKTHPLFPSFMFGFYTDGLVYDNTTGETMYFYHTKNRINEIRKMITKPHKKSKLTLSHMKRTCTEKEHTDAVHKVSEEIKKGNTFQCQFGFKTEYTLKGNPYNLYTQLRNINPSPHMFYFQFGKRAIIGASPELLLRVRNREIETYPLAGTIRRGKNPQEDRELARELLNDTKEQAEHTMLVDLHRNDIGKVSRIGSVRVRNLMDIKKFSHVQHISSEIAGLLAPHEDMFSALAANFPAGTLTGAPKIESIKIIDQLEKDPRGPYGGAVGHFGLNGDCTFAIPIRSLFVNDSYVYTQASSGIVYDSRASTEYDEILRKLRATEKVCEQYI